jgi:hypothetical protein
MDIISSRVSSKPTDLVSIDPHTPSGWGSNVPSFVLFGDSAFVYCWVFHRRTAVLSIPTGYNGRLRSGLLLVHTSEFPSRSFLRYSVYDFWLVTTLDSWPVYCWFSVHNFYLGFFHHSSLDLHRFSQFRLVTTANFALVYCWFIVQNFVLVPFFTLLYTISGWLRLSTLDWFIVGSWFTISISVFSITLLSTYIGSLNSDWLRRQTSLWFIVGS